MKVFDNIATYRKLECLVATGLLCLILSVDSFAQTTYYSKVSGDWDLASTWQTGGCGGGGPDAGPPTATDNVVVCNGQTVTLTGDVTIANLTINSGAFIDGAKNMEATGNIDIDGTYGDQAVMGGLTLSGANATMDGTGVIACKDGVTVSDGGSGGNKTILSTANLTVRKVFEIDNGLTVTNYGAISMIDNLNGGNASSTWVNESNSTLNAAKTLLNQGVLFASATGNTVNYNQAGNQNMKTPDANTYYHLQTQGNGIKKMFGGTNIILGNLTISATLDCNGNNINIAGNWINTGAFTTQTATVIFDGSSAQALTNLLGETFWDLTIDKSAGTLTLNNDASANNTLTMTQGLVDASTGMLILGFPGTEGTLSYTGGCIIGKFKRFIETTTVDFLYPLGTATYCRPGIINFYSFDNAGSVIGEFIPTDPGSSGLPLGEAPLSPADSVRNTFVEGYWSFAVADGFDFTTSTNTLQLDLVGSGFSSFAINTATRLLTRADAGSPWTLNGTNVTANPDTAKRDLITVLSGHYSFGDTTNCTGPVTGGISGVDSVCVSTSGSYSVPYAPPPVSTFDWTVIGGTIASGQGSSGITVNWGATGQVGQVQVVENNGCTDGAPVTKTVNIHTLPTSAITGNNGVGEFSTGEMYSVTGRPAYTYTWSITGGTLATGQGTSSITVNWGGAGSGNVRVTASTTCGSAPFVDLPVTIYSTIVSIDDGDWDGTIASQGWATWDCNCVPPITGNALVSTGDTVTFVGDTEINNFTVDSGGTLDAVGFKFKKVTGNLIVDGTYTGTNFIDMKGTSTVTLGGMGSITITGNDIKLSGGNVNISSSADLSVSLRDFKYNKAGLTVTNYGKITIVGNIVEKDITSTWINEANSTLNISGDLFAGDGVLAASATGNTINYNGGANQDIKCPNSGQYHHLTTAVSAIKTLMCNIDVNGNLTISGTSQLDVDAFTITIAGNWINNSTAADPFIQQAETVTFDGTGPQSITATGGETFYNLTVNKTVDTLTLNDNVTVSGVAASTLTMTAGNIKTGTNKLILGTATGNEGSLTHTSGTVVGKFERWMNTTATGYLFPIGTSSRYLATLITFNAGLTGGSLIGEFISTDPDVNGLYLVETSDTVFQVCEDGYWRMTTANGLASADFNLELTGNSFTGCVITPETRILTRAIAANPWTMDGGHLPAAGNTAKRINVTILSGEFALGDTAHCPVPVTAPISGPDSVCTDSLAAVYSVTPSAAYSTYVWTITGGTQASGGNTNSITVDWGSLGQVGSVQVVETTNCGAGSPVIRTVNIHTLPTTLITGKIQGLSQFAPPEPYSAVTCRPGYSYFWEVLQSGGTIMSGQGTCNITIRWDVPGLDTVRVTAYTDCDSAAPVILPVSIYGTIVSVQDGNWDVSSTWDCVCEPLLTDNAVIDVQDTVSLTVSDTINFLIISATGALNLNGFDLWVTDDFTINGNVYGTGNLYVNEKDAVLDGTGTIGNTGTLYLDSNKIIAGTANLTISSTLVSITAGDSVTNNGTVTITNNLAGGAGSVWVNASSSTLNIGGDLLTTGVLVASATGNTVNYNSSGNQLVKCPNGGQYYNLGSAGGGIKTLACNVDVNGNLSISGTSRLDASTSNYNINLAGNWTNTSTDATAFDPRSGTVVIDGSGAQSLTATGGENFFNLTVNKSANSLTLNDNATVSTTTGGTLTMTSGNIVTGTNTLKLGTSCANVGAVIYTGGIVVGRFERWIASTILPPSPVLFPVGSATTYRPALAKFNAVGTCGSVVNEYVTSNPGDNGLPINDSYYSIGNAFTEGHWSLTSGGLVSTDYDLDLVAAGYTSYPIVALTRLLKRVDAPTGWAITNWGTHVTTSGDTIRRSSIGDISDFDFGVGDTSGCSGLPATSIITGFDSVCTGDPGVSYSVDIHSPNLYFWSVAGGTQVSGGTSNSITVDWGTTGQIGSVSVIESDECGNRTAVSLPVKIHVLPTSAITGNNLVPISAPDEPYTVTNNAGYTYTWEVLQGLGVIDLGQGSNSLTVDWGATAGLDTVRVVASTGCGSDTSWLPVTIRGTIISIATGDWDQTATWDCGCVPVSTDDVIVDAGHTVTLVASSTANDLTVRSTGVLSNSAYIMTITGNYKVNGTHEGSGPINLTGTGTTIDGTGTISNSDVLRIQSSSKTVLVTANLTKSNGNFSIDDGFTVTNNGVVNISSNLTGGGSSNWVNASGSTLKVAGALLVSGALNASANPNRVVYNGTGNQTVKAGQYWHLTLSTGGTKTLGGAVDIDGNDTIKAGVNFASGNYNIVIAGNWINNGDFTSGTNTVTFDGTTTITGVVDTFNIVIISGSLTGYNGNMYMKGNWTNNGTYTHNGGTVRFTGTTTVLGSATTTFNTVMITSIGNLTAHAANMGLQGSFTNDNVFNHNGGTLTFSGSSTISGTTIPTRFNNIRITSIADLTGHSSNMEVAGNWVNDLSYTHNTGRVSFVGTDTVSGVATTNFYNITISGTGTLIGHSTEMRVAGPTMINSGTFTHNSGRVNFNGTTTLAGAGAFNFYHLTTSSTLTGPAGGTVGVAGDWINSGTFNHNSGTVAFNGSIAQTITNTAGETFYNLTINKSAGIVTLNDPVTIVTGGLLTLTQGIVITTAVNLLTVSDDATSNGGDADSYVDGPIRKVGNDAFIFPVGNGTVWARIGISNPSIVTTEYTAQYFDAGYTDTTTLPSVSYISQMEYWTLDQAVNDDDISATLYWESSTRSGIDAFTTDLVVAHYNGADWEDVGNTAITGGAAGDVTSGLVADYSPFTFASKTKSPTTNPLPISLLLFEAELIIDVVRVEWVTLSESNNDFFTVERSQDGLDFEFLTYVQGYGAGTTSSLLDYSIIDANPLYGTSYYRLKQTDIDGHSETFIDKIVAVTYEPEAEMAIVVYPNPTEGKFWVDVEGKEGDEVLVVVLDMLGSEHYSKIVIIENSGYTLAFDPNGRLSPGVYMIVGSSNNKLYSKKLVIR